MKRPAPYTPWLECSQCGAPDVKGKAACGCPNPKYIPRPILACTGCGAEVQAGCTCGVSYKLKPGGRAAKAVAAHPEKSDRAIAADADVSLGSVQRARKATDSKESVGAKRIGRDGKSRRMPAKAKPKAAKRKAPQTPPDDQDQADAADQKFADAVKYLCTLVHKPPASFLKAPVSSGQLNQAGAWLCWLADAIHEAKPPEGDSSHRDRRLN